jgi:hypothetical protein
MTDASDQPFVIYYLEGFSLRLPLLQDTSTDGMELGACVKATSAELLHKNPDLSRLLDVKH